MANRNDDGTEVELSSPACSMHEADDQYMGYASKDELITFLNELLEAERAGARVTLESARAAEWSDLRSNASHSAGRGALVRHAARPHQGARRSAVSAGRRLLWQSDGYRGSC